MNSVIERMGFENLDVKRNLGHSIERRQEYRRYIEKGNPSKLSDAEIFTFEPRTRRPGSLFGY